MVISPAALNPTTKLTGVNVMALLDPTRRFPTGNGALKPSGPACPNGRLTGDHWPTAPPVTLKLTACANINGVFVPRRPPLSTTTCAYTLAADFTDTMPAPPAVAPAPPPAANAPLQVFV
jgi:hypothetical protein